MLSKYPKAELTLVDQAENMPDLARKRFKNMPNINYISGDYTEVEFTDKYDAVISALSIHHLENHHKKILYIISVLNYLLKKVFL